MGDNVEFPVAPSTALIGTDEVDLRGDEVLVQVPFGKILDGGDGGTRRLRITEAGGIVNQGIFSGGFGFGAIGQTSYTAGDIVGGGIKLCDIGGGFWNLVGLRLIVADFIGGGTLSPGPMPDIDVLMVGVPNPSGAPSTLFPDGAAASAVISGVFLLNAVPVPASEFVPDLVVPGASSVAAPNVKIGVTTANLIYSEHGEVWAIPIANTPIGTDLTDYQIGMAVTMEFAGDSSTLITPS